MTDVNQTTNIDAAIAGLRRLPQAVGRIFVLIGAGEIDLAMETLATQPQIDEMVADAARAIAMVASSPTPFSREEIEQAIRELAASQAYYERVSPATAIAAITPIAAEIPFLGREQQCSNEY